jgi:hypothetical protein
MFSYSPSDISPITPTSRHYLKCHATVANGDSGRYLKLLPFYRTPFRRRVQLPTRFMPGSRRLQRTQNNSEFGRRRIKRDGKGKGEQDGKESV